MHECQLARPRINECGGCLGRVGAQAKSFVFVAVRRSGT